ncbi:hypothetical protein SLEP1_g40166 [Rubroshorea leprosula]|uniref:BZIP domain-containing protein n=1 Tax=Rubroshorea leprosula TaxID=152421 RepID=A0AAV5L3F8_9ROSI|nr:hypothetical protein SLEP1_g40166 [Rubroshorea leprosula]
MESPRNPNLCEGGGDGISFPEDQFPTISQQNFPIQDMTTAAQIESMMVESVYSDQFLQEDLSWRNNSTNVSSEQNPPVINQTAAGSTKQIRQQQSGQRQPADRSFAISSSENATPDPRARKRETDRRYRVRTKEDKEQMKSTLDKLEAENEYLRKEIILGNQKFDELKKKYEKQHKKRKQIEAENESLKEEKVLVKKRFEKWRKKCEKQLAENIGGLKDEIIESLKEDIVLANGSSSRTQSHELGQVRSELENLKKELASLKTYGHRQTGAGSSNNLNGGTLNMHPSYPAFPSVASSPATRPPASPLLCKEYNDYIQELQSDDEVEGIYIVT